MGGSSQKAMTYSSVAARPLAVTGTNKKPVKKATVVLIRPKEECKLDTSEQIKEQLVKMVLPALKSVRVRNIRKTRERGLIIETDSVADLTKIKESAEIQSIGLNVVEPHKLGPKMLIYDIDKGMNDDVLKQEIYNRNIEEFGLSEVEFKENMQILFRTGRQKERVSNVIIEVGCQVRRLLLRTDRVCQPRIT